MSGLPKVFISHASTDKWAARRISADIEQIGATTFLDEKDIATGASIDDMIKTNLASCDDFLVLLSPSSIKSEWVLLELGGAFALGKNIVPIMLHVGVNDLPKAITLKLARDINEIERYYEELRKRVPNAAATAPARATRKTARKPTAKTPPVLKFRPGDKIRIVPTRPSETPAFTDLGWDNAMDAFLGHDATVTDSAFEPHPFVDRHHPYHLDIDSGVWAWAQEWLLPN